jgi:ketosteroid isomerase-like protein
VATNTSRTLGSFCASWLAPTSSGTRRRFEAQYVPGIFNGVDETNAWLADWLDSFEDWSIVIEEVFDAGDQVVAIVRQRGTAKHGGPEVEMRVAQVWTFRGGLAARMEMYADRDEALEAVGLSK